MLETAAERATVDWTAVKNFATNGITADYSPVSNDDVFNNFHSWTTFLIDGAGAAGLPVDLQVPHLADPSYPATYPATGFLGAASTTDARFGEFSDGVDNDFEYTPSIGWLREDRNKSIFTNYSGRRYAYNHDVTVVGNPMNIFNAYENQLLLAEAEFNLGNNMAAKTIIDAGERSTRGNLPALADATDATIDNALHYENVIGLHGLGGGISLAYMRRYDRLQEGSILHFPVPAAELEITGEELYNFGGAGRGSEDGTASGANAWK